MPKLTSQQVKDLANNFLVLAQSIGDFRERNWNNLSKLDNQRLGNLQWSVLNSVEDILAFSTIIIMDDIQGSLTKIKKVTSEIKTTVKTLKDIQKGISIAAAAVTLGAAIISRNPQAIVDAIKGLVKAVTDGGEA